MVTLKEAMEEHFVGKEQLAELQKAMTTAEASAGDIIEPEIDPRLQNMIVQKYPFYTWLQSTGAITDTLSNKPSYLAKTRGASSSFIAEAGTITAGQDSTYDLVTGDMTTWICPLELSDQLIMGSQGSILDVLDQEIQDALELHIADINKGMLVDDGDTNKIKGLKSLITTNTANMAGAEITSKFVLDDMCETIMEAGGSPSAIVTSANVRAQLEEILYPNINIPLLPKQELAFGYRVMTYDSPAGTIPIISDPAMPTTANEQCMFFVDYSTLMLKYLMNPRVIELAKTKLTESSVVASFQSFMCRAEEFNGQIYGIGTKTA